MKQVVAATDLAIAGASAVVLLPLTGVVAFPSLPFEAALMVVGLAAIAHVALALRVTRPELTLAVVAAVCAVQMTLTGLFFVMPSVLVFPVVIYSAAAYGRRILALAVGVLGALSAAIRYSFDDSVIRADFGPEPWLLFLLFFALVVVAWLMGVLRRSHRDVAAFAVERARSAEADKESRTERAVLEERARISRDLHDILAHSLSIIVGQARAARFDSTRTESALAVIEETGRQSLTEIRGILRVFRPAGDAERSPSPTLADIPALLEQSSLRGHAVTLDRIGQPADIGNAAQLAVYRFVQEALTNVSRHAAHGAPITISEEWLPNLLSVSVSNDDVGRPAGGEESEAGFGLVGMLERLESVGGSLTVDAGDGFTITARVPYSEARVP